MPRENDYIQQLANYIKKNVSKGYTPESLRWALINQGYSRTSVERAIELANEQLAKQAPKMIEKPVIKIEKTPMYTKLPTEGKSFWQKIKDIFS